MNKRFEFVEKKGFLRELRSLWTRKQAYSTCWLIGPVSED